MFQGFHLETDWIHSCSSSVLASSLGRADFVLNWDLLDSKTPDWTTSTNLESPQEIAKINLMWLQCISISCWVISEPSLLKITLTLNCPCTYSTARPLDCGKRPRTSSLCTLSSIPTQQSSSLSCTQLCFSICIMQLTTNWQGMHCSLINQHLDFHTLERMGIESVKWHGFPTIVVHGNNIEVQSRSV